MQMLLLLHLEDHRAVVIQNRLATYFSLKLLLMRDLHYKQLNAKLHIAVSDSVLVNDAKEIDF
jgi:hypothetical protein